MSFNIAIILFPTVFAIIAYLLGSINFAILITRIATGEDIRSHGSKNAGMTNVMRTVGAKSGVLTLVGDAVKAVIAVSLGKFLLPFILKTLYPSNTDPLMYIYGAYLCGFFVILGHILPIYFKFKGGKGIVTIISALLVINWKLFFVMLIIWLIIFAFSKIISLASVLACSLYPFILFFTYNFLSLPDINGPSVLMSFLGIPLQWFETIAGTLMVSMVIFMHRSNISRLIKGEEKKLSVKKGKK